MAFPKGPWQLSPISRGRLGTRLGYDELETHVTGQVVGALSSYPATSVRPGRTYLQDQPCRGSDP